MPLHCPLLAVDVAAFGHRYDDVQVFVRKALYAIIEGAFQDAGIPWRICHREDRGDGVLVVVPPMISVARLIHPLADHLRAALRVHNKMASDIAKIRLRMAIDAGYVYLDTFGVTGLAMVRLFRLLEAPLFKDAFAATSADLGLVTSSHLYNEVIRHSPGLIDPDMYRPIAVELKETRTSAWVYIPPVRSRRSFEQRPRIGTDLPAEADIRDAS